MTDEPTRPPDASRSEAGTPQGPDPGLMDQPAPVSETPQQRSDTERSGQEAPLITAIEIENFKGIGRPVRFDLRPITLLFGRNSAGKSTILHALCYAYEILSHRNVDARTTELGGDQIDLGGFRQFVHRHDMTRPVRLRFELSLRNRNWPGLQPETFNSRIEPFPTPDEFVGPVKTGWVELATRWREDQNAPILSEYEVGVDGQLLGRLEVVAPSDRPKRIAIAISGSRSRFRPSADLFLNLLHPMFHSEAWRDLVVPSPAAGEEDTGDLSGEQSDRPRLHKQALSLPSALPFFDYDLPISKRVDTGDDLDDFYRAVSVVLNGAGTLLRKELATSRYIGPLRSLSARHGEGGDRSDPGLWADGSAAWEALHGSESIVDDVNSWISPEHRLNTGYELRIRSTVDLPGDSPLVRRILEWKRQKQLPESLAKMWRLELRDHFASPGDIVNHAEPEVIQDLADGIAQAHVRTTVEIVTIPTGVPVRTFDVGVGISQMLPVVVAALDPERPEITAIEQPELHVHPRLQVELGDLFAEQTAGGRAFLIETHSEHLMLRLLRRIEETASGELPEGKPALKPDQVSVVYVDQVEGEVRATRIRIDETGEFIDRWPQGFFDERTDELF